VLIHGRKLAGVLVELSSGQRRGVAAVVGIGINLHLPPEADIPHEGGVTDLAACLEQPPGPNQLLALILTRLHALFALYGASGFGALRAAWEQRNAFAGLPVRIIDETREQHGSCAGVDEDGALLLETADGVLRVLSGEVSLRLA
jgi:BirA family biotin operon repressor/biotin-[acetyl-CoA-carboxylase] ligase